MPAFREAEISSNVSIEGFRHAFALVSSRAFMVDVYRGLAMVPIADACVTFFPLSIVLVFLGVFTGSSPGNGTSDECVYVAIDVKWQYHDVASIHSRIPLFFSPSFFFITHLKRIKKAHTDMLTFLLLKLPQTDQV